MKSPDTKTPFDLRWIIVVFTASWFLVSTGDAGAEVPPGAVADIVAAVREKNPEDALKLFADAVDQGFIDRDLVYSDLPSAAAAIYRSLMQLDVEQRYELLESWTFPATEQPAIRQLSIPVPVDAPPKVFARSLGERPRDTTFAVSQVGPIEGCFSSGWMLAQAADELGRLSRLRTRLDELQQQQIEGAEPLALLAQLAGSRGDLSRVSEHLSSVLTSKDAGVQLTPNDLVDATIAMASLQHGELRNPAEAALSTIVDRANQGTGIALRPLLRIAHAIAVQVHRGESGPDTLFRNRLKYWVPASARTATTISRGYPDGAWLTHEQHVLHLAGSNANVLLCRFPLIGQFDFICEAQEGGSMGTDGGLVYGGLHFQALGRNNTLTVWDADGQNSVTRSSPFARHESVPVFNRVSIRSSAQSANFESNFHPVWFDQAPAASPWIGLRSEGAKRPVFRNLRLSGSPTIPREVRLSEGDQLRGWQSGFFGESQPGFGGKKVKQDSSPADATDAVTSLNWFIESGEIVGSALDSEPAVSPGLLQYQRPLLEDESITYEFLYQGDQSVVHPSVGRLAFLLEPTGVRVRWITTGTNDWTGLEPDNASLEPLNRRGPRPLPMKDGQWNKVRIEMTGEDIVVKLNGQTIYERPRDSNATATFGLYRPSRGFECRIKNVIMTGDWPETLPEEFVANPVAIQEVIRPGVEDQSTQPIIRSDAICNDVIGRDTIAENVLEIRRMASALPTKQRYHFLSHWILPNEHHDNFRISGDNLPASLPPLAQDDPAFRSPVNRVVSPVFDLLKTASDLSMTKTLRSRVESLQTIELPDEIARSALLAMIDLKIGNDEAAEQNIVDLHDYLQKSSKETVSHIWPALLVAHHAAQTHSRSSTTADLVAYLHSTCVSDNQSRLPAACLTDIHALNAKMRGERHGVIASHRKTKDGEARNTLNHWIPVSPTNAATRGNRNVDARWTRSDDNTVTHLCGAATEYLAYESPLTGNFCVDADVSNHQLGQLLNGGRFFGHDYNLSRFQAGELGGPLNRSEVPKAFGKFDRWVHYRTNVTELRQRSLIDGKLIEDQPIDSGAAPWIALRSWYKSTAQFQNVVISGTPEIPDQISLSSSRSLSGWNAYHSAPLYTSGASWQAGIDEDSQIEIVGKRRPELAGSACERLIRYFRPLGRQSSVEFDFFYQPDRSSVAPALDRLALVITPEGIAEHWITDGRYDRTLLRPDNLQFVTEYQQPEHQQHDRQFPLEASAWNRAKLEVIGDEVLLSVNDALVYRRRINPSNDRTFGLFHFADQGEARVRNVSMRGDWPKELPQPQQLADPTADLLDQRLPELRSVFAHDFRSVDQTTRYFNAKAIRENFGAAESDDGLRLTVSSYGPWKQAAASPQFSMRGDFDVVASISDARWSDSAKLARVALVIPLEDEYARKLISGIGFSPNQGSYLTGAVNMHYPNGTTGFMTKRRKDESKSGRLRIARRGEKIFCLFAHEHSESWRLLHQGSASTAPVPIGGIQLLNIANGPGTTSAVWESITLRAEEMMTTPETEPPSTLSIVRIDGSEIHDLATPLGDLTTVGSPDWSPDGKWIAYDSQRGTTLNARLMKVSRSGGDPIDMGFGSMPVFSPDGKQIAFSASRQGVGIMNADGSNRRILDPSGWGMQWSPTGNQLAYSKRGNLYVWDLDNSTSRAVLPGDSANRYSYIYWNMCWSPGGDRVALKGRRRDGSGDEIAVVTLARPARLTTIVSNFKSGGGDLCWSPDGKRLIVPMVSPGTKSSRLYEVDLRADGELRLVPKLPIDRTILTATRSPDGKWLAITGKYKPSQVPWMANGETDSSSTSSQ